MIVILISGCSEGRSGDVVSTSNRPSECPAVETCGLLPVVSQTLIKSELAASVEYCHCTLAVVSVCGEFEHRILRRGANGEMA